MNLMKKHIRKLSKKYKAQVLRDIFALSQKDIDDYVMKVAPLQKGDKLFVESNNPSDPKISMSNSNDIYFEQGYASAAIFLLNVVEYGKNNLRKDSYIYPALFCLRMYLEIIMKLILSNYHVDIKGKGHDLMKLWLDVKSSVITDSNSIDVITTESLLEELSSQDNSMATAFRYPQRLNAMHGQKVQSKINTLVDIRILRERFLQLYGFFDGLYDLSIVNGENK